MSSNCKHSQKTLGEFHANGNNWDFVIYDMPNAATHSHESAIEEDADTVLVENAHAVDMEDMEEEDEDDNDEEDEDDNEEEGEDDNEEEVQEDNTEEVEEEVQEDNDEEVEEETQNDDEEGDEDETHEEAGTPQGEGTEEDIEDEQEEMDGWCKRSKKLASIGRPPQPPRTCTYANIKRIFEEECVKISTPFVYVRKYTEDGLVKYVQFKYNELRQYYSEWTYYAVDVRTNEQVKTSFIKKWLDDPTKRVCSTIVVDPQCKRSDVCNIWTGYDAANLKVSQYFSDIEDVESFVMGPIMHHVEHVIADGNKEHVEWIIDWLANVAQRPWMKSQVGIFLYGRQGCGKGLIFDWYRTDVLGLEHTFQTADPERDLFSRFSDGLINRTLIQVDEAKNLYEHADKLKNIITSSTLTWEQKGGKIMTVQNMCNLIFTSNHSNVLHIPGDDRRFCLFECNPKYVGDKEYFNKLVAHLKTPGVNAHFYKFLKKRDLSKYKYDFQSNRPKTIFYEESQRSSIPQEKRYLSALVNNSASVSWGASEMYKHFHAWAQFEGYKTIKTNTAFARDIKKVKGMTCHKTMGMMKYLLDLDEVKLQLRKMSEYDESSFLHDSVQ